MTAQAVTTGAVLFCTSCGTELPGPGEACPACPQLDERRQAIVARYQHQLAELRAIDAEENATRLRDEAGQARALVVPAAGTRPLEEAVTRAVAAERTAQDRLRGARGHLREVARAEEKARRDQASPEVLTEAIMRARAAGEVVAEVAQAAAVATGNREAAEQALAAHLSRLAVLEDTAAAAERAAATPPETVPPSPWTALLAHPLAVLLLPDLGEEGRVLVGAQVATLARIAGVAEELRAEGRAALEAELADKTRHPHQLQALGNGQVAVYPNPLHPDVPTQASPPGPGAGQGFTAPLIPRLGS